jgi:hypothetical protein
VKVRACCLSISAAIVWLAAGSPPLDAADAGSRVEYVGGTLTSLPSKADGRVSTSDPRTLVFRARGQDLRMAYGEINLLEYGQQTGRRYIMALAISPLLLLSKSRKHFLTLGYKDVDGSQQALVFQVHKNDVRALLASLEARTGLKVNYQDDEARKAGGG